MNEVFDLLWFIDLSITAVLKALLVIIAYKYLKRSDNG
tara:strand:+ start:325 stop:438 length:114 start_codon:yes stop_codon:yes gene_type:complete